MVQDELREQDRFNRLRDQLLEEQGALAERARAVTDDLATVDVLLRNSAIEKYVNTLRIFWHRLDFVHDPADLV